MATVYVIFLKCIDFESGLHDIRGYVMIHDFMSLFVIIIVVVSDNTVSLL